MAAAQDIVTEELHGLESIIANPNIPIKDKREAIREYEHVLSEHAGITLMALQEIKTVVHHSELTAEQRINELKGLEAVFLGGIKKTLINGGKPFGKREREQWRRMFRRYVNQHFRIKMQVRMRTKSGKMGKSKAKKESGKRAREPPKHRPR